MEDKISNMEDKICKTCKHFNNVEFGNKSFGYCKQLEQHIYCEDKDGNVIDEEKVVIHEDFGCIHHDKL